MLENSLVKRFRGNYMPSVLIPIITNKENNSDLTSKLYKMEKVALVFIMDSDSTKTPSGLVGGSIKNAEETMGEIRKKLKPRGIEVKEYLEWGNVIQKIENIYRLENVDKIMMIKSPEAEKLLKHFKKRDLKTELVEVQ